MMAIFVAAAAVAVERLINKRRLRLHEVLADMGWLTLIFALIEFAYLFFVEALTLNYGVFAKPLWYTEWSVFKSLMLETAVGVMLIFTSVWLESAGVRVELRRPQLRRAVAKRPPPPPTGTQSQKEPDTVVGMQQQKCDIEWREAS